VCVWRGGEGFYHDLTKKTKRLRPVAEEGVGVDISCMINAGWITIIMLC
jgi:hypothetical protein